MPIGVLVNCAAVLLGCLVGAPLGKALPQRIKDKLPLGFGVCSLGIGINSVVKVHSMTPVVLALLTGLLIGTLIHLEKHTRDFFKFLVKTFRLGGENVDMDMYITIVALFCCSGFGWYSVLTEAMTGDPSLLFSKAVLDFFTALVFASTLGISTVAIPFPQVVILMAVFLVGKLLAPYLTPTMFADLSGLGGILTLAAGFRVSKIKDMPIVDMMPALILVMPFSMLWSAIGL
ncbi:MAG: DUF554 domain-containing protein [Clostridia bacterium]|nr:DUF554 domain-containing protein [Clostridia bacterium]